MTINTLFFRKINYMKFIELKVFFFKFVTVKFKYSYFQSLALRVLKKKKKCYLYYCKRYQFGKILVKLFVYHTLKVNRKLSLTKQCSSDDKLHDIIL